MDLINHHDNILAVKIDPIDLFSLSLSLNKLDNLI